MSQRLYVQRSPNLVFRQRAALGRCGAGKRIRRETPSLVIPLRRMSVDLGVPPAQLRVPSFQLRVPSFQLRTPSFWSFGCDCRFSADGNESRLWIRNESLWGESWNSGLSRRKYGDASAGVGLEMVIKSSMRRLLLLPLLLQELIIGGEAAGRAGLRGETTSILFIFVIGVVLVRLPVLVRNVAQRIVS